MFKHYHKKDIGMTITMALVFAGVGLFVGNYIDSRLRLKRTEGDSYGIDYEKMIEYKEEAKKILKKNTDIVEDLGYKISAKNYSSITDKPDSPSLVLSTKQKQSDLVEIIEYVDDKKDLHRYDIIGFSDWETLEKFQYPDFTGKEVEENEWVYNEIEEVFYELGNNGHPFVDISEYLNGDEISGYLGEFLDDWSIVVIYDRLSVPSIRYIIRNEEYMNKEPFKQPPELSGMVAAIEEKRFKKYKKLIELRYDVDGEFVERRVKIGDTDKWAFIQKTHWPVNVANMNIIINWLQHNVGDSLYVGENYTNPKNIWRVRLKTSND